MQYRRAKVKGVTYFFTVVTEKRQKILCLPKNVSLLRSAFHYVMQKHPFIIDAIVILPNHLHCIWTLPENDHDYSTRWRLIKSYFSRNRETILPENISISRQKKQQRAIWQYRFWEHLIRDEIDFQNHVEYIHYNPVKHGLVTAQRIRNIPVFIALCVKVYMTLCGVRVRKLFLMMILATSRLG